MKLLAVALPVTAKLVNVPTDVILPCAAVVTVPATTAVVAFGTVPVTLAPGILVRPAPDPLNCDPVTVPVTDTNPPVWLAALTIVVAITLLAAMLPDVLSIPVVFRLPPMMLPETDTVVPVKLATFTTVVNMPLLATAFPVALIVVATRLAPFTLPTVLMLPLIIFPTALIVVATLT